MIRAMTLSVRGTVRSVITRKQCGNGTARTVFDEPQVLWLRLILKHLQVVKSAVLVGFLPQELPTGHDNFVRIHLNRGRSRKKRLVRCGLEHVAGVRMVQRNLLLLP